tara:strand:- start:53 stop:742 length:690 start_codon:yes stop_codon:yes gene_type:complete
MLMAKSGETVKIIHKGTGREYNVTLTSDLTTTTTRLDFSSTTFDTIIPEGSIIIQSNLDKWDTIFRDYTIVTHKLYESGNTHGNTSLINPRYPSIMDIDGGSTWSDGDTLANSYLNNSIFRASHDGCKIERVTWDINSDATTGHNAVFSLWKKPITELGNTATDITLVDTTTYTAQNDINYVLNRDTQNATTLNSNDCLIPSFKKSGSASSSDKFYATLTLLISTDPRQ